MQFAAGYHFIVMIRWSPVVPANVLKGCASNRIPDLFKPLRAAEGVTKTATKTLCGYFSSDLGERDCHKPTAVSVDGCEREPESRWDKQ